MGEGKFPTLGYSPQTVLSLKTWIMTKAEATHCIQVFQRDDKAQGFEPSLAGSRDVHQQEPGSEAEEELETRNPQWDVGA